MILWSTPHSGRGALPSQAATATGIHPVVEVPEKVDTPT